MLGNLALGTTTHKATSSGEPPPCNNPLLHQNKICGMGLGFRPQWKAKSHFCGLFKSLTQMLFLFNAINLKHIKLVQKWTKRIWREFPGSSKSHFCGLFKSLSKSCFCSMQKNLQTHKTIAKVDKKNMKRINFQGLPKATFVDYLKAFFPNPVFVQCKKPHIKTTSKVGKKNMKRISRVFQKPLLWTI